MPDFTIKNQLNLASRANFRVEIPALPIFSAFCQSFDMPSITLGVALQPTPLVEVKHPGDKINFDDFSFDFLLDEHMTNYKEIFEWIMQLGYPRNTSQYAQLSDSDNPYKRKQDIYITSLTNKLNVFNTIVFVGCFPINLGGIEFNHSAAEPEHPICSVMFAYDYFYFSDKDLDGTL